MKQISGFWGMGAWRGAGGRDDRGSQTFEVMDIFTIVIVVTFHGCIHVSKRTKFCTLYNLLYFNYTSIMLV